MLRQTLSRSRITAVAVLRGPVSSLIAQVIVITTLMVLFTGSPAIANTSGTFYISTNTVLSENHDGDIVVLADNLTVDCQNHSVSGSGQAVGILLDGRTGVTIKNCQVSGFTRGVLV